MKNRFQLLSQVPLFLGLTEDELDQLLPCLGATERHFPKDGTILHAGDPATSVGILLEGQAQVIRQEHSGDRTILTELQPGDLFAEAFAFASGGRARPLPVTVISVTVSTVLMADCHKIIANCSAACGFHTRLIENMLAVLADKNLLLNRKLGHLSKRTTGEKLLSYLSEQATLHGDMGFEIPFNRQQLADYLCVERSAMSAALCKLRDENLLRFSRNRFELLTPGNRKLPSV